MTSDLSNQNGENRSIRPGTSVASYNILHHIDSGGMGDVYLAEDTTLNRRVALKFIPAEHCQNEDSRRRFKSEANAAAALSHPNIVTVYHIGEHDGQPFIAMEYVEGRPLKDLISENGMRFEQAIDIAAQICDGLAEAHAAGLVHCDVKPSNILVDKKGRVRILDFGLARLCETQDYTVTRDAGSMLTGTIQYMSPEQVGGETLTPASDLFSFGIVFYEMLAGQRPFKGTYEAAIMYAISNENPPPISARRPDLPAGVQEFLNRLLEKNPAKRYQSAADVAAALRELRPSIRRQRTVRRRYVSLSVSVVTIAIVVWLIVRYLSPPIEPRGPHTVAVLPFDNLSSVENDYFADGMTDAIITRLAQVGDLNVISRRSAMKYKGSDKAIRDIGEELKADYVLTGTVSWDKSGSDDVVKINAHLIDARDEKHLWARSYERLLEKIFAVQGDIAGDVALSLTAATADDWLADSSVAVTSNIQAYDFYLRGNEYFCETFDRTDIESAILLYERAVAADSNFAAAYAMLGRAHASMYWEYYDRSEQRRELARAAVDRALALQPNLVQARLANAYYHYHCRLDYERALKELDQARRLQPNNPEVLNAVAAIERRRGNLVVSAENFRRALELDPRSHLKAFDVALTYGMMREQTAAIEYIERTLTLAPDWSLPHIYHAWLYVLDDGDTARARSILERADDRTDLSTSAYYWWLERVIEPDPRRVLRLSKLGDDTVAYQLHKAQMYRLMNRHSREVVFADSAMQRLHLKLLERPSDAKLHSRLGLAHAGLRQRDSAVYHASLAVELLPTSREAFDAPFLIMNLAEVYTIFGEYDRAIESLHILLLSPGLFSAPYLRLDPLWRPLYDHEGFQKLLVDAA